ncbi:MAG: UDP-N-acetylmuramoyl-L-alanine--D-glutamate ligase [Candidatus Brocadiales bacterium]
MIDNNMFRDKKITVMGLGLFGGGAGLARFLVRQGARLVITDLKTEEQLASSLATLDGPPVELHLGGHREDDFKGVDMVMVNPAVPRDSRFLQIAKENNVPLDTEMNLFFRLCRAPILGVTGTKGKSTTTALIGEMLHHQGRRVWVGGNLGLGYSLLERIDEIATDDLVVLELSSFQLEDLSKLRMSPHVSIITNIAPNHLDRHGSYAEYIEAKRNIIRFQGPNDYCIMNLDDRELRKWPADTMARVLWFSTKDVVESGAFVENGKICLRLSEREPGEIEVSCLSNVKIPGAHNAANILAASCAAFLMGAGGEHIDRALREFSGLEHRLEFVCDIDGACYYNDSIATTPESAIAGLRAFEGPIVLIAGGYDKGIPFDALAEECLKRTKCVILIGSTAQKIGELIARARRGSDTPEVIFASSLEGAVRSARNLAQRGDTVLLSPACASYDMFVNFEDRGRQFKALVREAKQVKVTRSMSRQNFLM